MTDGLGRKSIIKSCPRCNYIYTSSPIPAYVGKGLLQSLIDDCNKITDKRLKEEPLKSMEENNE